jgi:hypothetical protein
VVLRRPLKFRAGPEKTAETVFTKLELKLLEKLKYPPHAASPALTTFTSATFSKKAAIERLQLTPSLSL